MRFQRLISIAFVIIISACVSKESIVIPPAKPFDHPQSLNLSTQEIQANGDTIIFGKNKKYTNGNIKIVYLQGSPFEIGYAHGKLLKKEIEDQAKIMIYTIKSRFLGTNIGINLLTQRAKDVEKHIPSEYLEELHGISVGSNLDYDTLLMINALYTTARIFYGCTSFAFRDQQSNIVRSRNLDWHNDSFGDAFTGMIIYIVKPHSGYGFFCINRPGWINCATGMNEMGLTLGDHYLGGNRQKTWNKIPPNFLQRKIIQYSKTIDDVEEQFKQNTPYPMAMYLVSSKNGAAVFEMANDKFARIEMEDDYIALSNHAKVIHSRKWDDTVDRLNQANEYLKRNLEPMDVEMAIDLNRTELISRSDYGNSNRHSVIFNSNDLNFWVAKPEEPQKAPACFGTYTGFNLLKELYGQGHDPDPPYFPAKDRRN
jgi:predicted choloylglycine hydrolase